MLLALVGSIPFVGLWLRVKLQNLRNSSSRRGDN